MATSLELVWGQLITPGQRTNLDGLTPAAISPWWELSRTTRVIPPVCIADGGEVGTQLGVPHSDGGAIRPCSNIAGKENLL